MLEAVQLWVQVNWRNVRRGDAPRDRHAHHGAYLEGEHTDVSP